MQMATSGRHDVFFEADQSRILVVRVLHDRMDYQRYLQADAGPTGAGESAQAARLSSSTARNHGTTRVQLAKVWLTRTEDRVVRRWPAAGTVSRRLQNASTNQVDPGGLPKT
jgi:hypothetical protein